MTKTTLAAAIATLSLTGTAQGQTTIDYGRAFALEPTQTIHSWEIGSQEDVYGPGVKESLTGKPYVWSATIGPKGQIHEFIQVKPDAYGLGVGMDQFGRPVEAVTKP
jgi:hypothetical protein